MDVVYLMKCDTLFYVHALHAQHDKFVTMYCINCYKLLLAILLVSTYLF